MISGKDSENIYKLYLYDLGCLINEMAIDSKLEATKIKSDFSYGYMAGFHRVVSLMKQQAEAFNISQADIALDGFDPDKELV